MNTTTKQLIHRASQKYGISRDLIEAMVKVESAGNPDAMKTEKRYPYLWDLDRKEPRRVYGLDCPEDFAAPSYVSQDTEFWGQRTSWGLMQVMGAVARERGFDGKYFTALCSNQQLGLDIGCRHLVSMHRRFGDPHGWPGAVAAYNAGSVRMDGERFVNQGYVDKVRNAGGL